MGFSHDFNFKTIDALIISLVFNFGCICFLLLFKFLSICQKNLKDKLKETKGIQPETLQRQRVLITTAFRITQQLLTLTTVILGCVSLNESEVLKYPFYFPTVYSIPLILKLTFNINIGRYLFFSFGNIVMTIDSKFPALIIHHIVTLCTYTIISSYQQNTFLGICGLFMELSTTPVAISRILRDTNLHAKNMYGYYIFIMTGCNLTLVFRGIVPMICLTFACYTQNPFRMKSVSLVLFFMSVFFFGIINVWMIVQAFYTYSHTKEKKKSLSVRTPSYNTTLPSPSPLKVFTQIGPLIDKIPMKKMNKDFLKSTQTDGKKIVFENNLSSKAAQLSEKKVNISLNTRQNGQTVSLENTHIVNEQHPNINTNVSSEYVEIFGKFVNQ